MGISFPNMWGGKKVFFKENAWCWGNIVGFEKWTKSSAAVRNIQFLLQPWNKIKMGLHWAVETLCVCVGACVGVFIQWRWNGDTLHTCGEFIVLNELWPAEVGKLRGINLEEIESGTRRRRFRLISPSKPRLSIPPHSSSGNLQCLTRFVKSP